MEPLKKLVSNIFEDRLSESEELFNLILKEKLHKKLEEKKMQFSFKESNGKFKYHVNVTQPHLAFEKNNKERENLEKKLDAKAKQ